MWAITIAWPTACPVEPPSTAPTAAKPPGTPAGGGAPPHASSGRAARYGWNCSVGGRRRRGVRGPDQAARGARGGVWPRPRPRNWKHARKLAGIPDVRPLRRQRRDHERHPARSRRQDPRPTQLPHDPALRTHRRLRIARTGKVRVRIEVVQTLDSLGSAFMGNRPHSSAGAVGSE